MLPRKSSGRISGVTTSCADAHLVSVDATNSSEKELKIIPSIDVGSDIKVVYGRADIQGTTLDVIDETNGNGAGAAGGRIAILTCGPVGMADEARAAVHKALKQGKRGFCFFVDPPLLFLS